MRSFARRAATKRRIDFIERFTLGAARKHLKGHISTCRRGHKAAPVIPGIIQGSKHPPGEGVKHRFSLLFLHSCTTFRYRKSHAWPGLLHRLYPTRPTPRISQALMIVRQK